METFERILFLLAAVIASSVLDKFLPPLSLPLVQIALGAVLALAVPTQLEWGIDPELLAKYRAIKQHCARPIAKLYGDQCGGCNMNIPQASLRAFKSGAKMIECANCGRMLIQL